MTTVITRYFEDAGQAHAVKDELVYRQRVPRSIIRIVAQADGLDGLIDGGRILPDTGAAYKERMANGGAVLVVAAGYKPLGVAKIARNAMESMGAVDMGDLSQEVKTKDEGKGLSIIQGQTLMMTRQIDSAAMRYHMADWPIPLISRRKPFARALFDIHARMANFPIPLLSGRKPYADQIYVDKHQRMATFPIGLLVPGHRYMAKFPFAHHVPHDKRYGRFPFGLLVPGHPYMAKFPFGHLVPGHARMASVPFPLLINGKQGGNAMVSHNRRYGRFPFGLLVPGHKYQANFPIGHHVSHNLRYGRFPFGLLVPGHKYMAKFPFAHLVPGHKRMANFPLPLIIKKKPRSERRGFSIGRALGISRAA